MTNKKHTNILHIFLLVCGRKDPSVTLRLQLNTAAGEPFIGILRSELGAERTQKFLATSRIALLSISQVIEMTSILTD